ncbi:MAG: hypothetical protein WCS85_01275 [Candidatus Peribacteraceae bacterium]|jgi:hypothetical protein
MNFTLRLFVFFAIAVFLFAIAWFFRNWRKLDKVEIRAAAISQFATMAITVILLLFTLQANRNETISIIQDNQAAQICQYNQVIVNDVVELIATHTHQAQYEIGIPEECYADQSGNDLFLVHPEIYSIPFEQFRVTEAILKAKLRLVLIPAINGKIGSAYEKYVDALSLLEKQCRRNPNFSDALYREARQQVTNSGNSLIGELSNLMLSCHRRSFFDAK